MLQTTEETELTMPSDFRWHSFLVSADYLPDTKYRNGMKRVDVWWTSWESAVIGDFGGVLIILEISVDFQGVM